MIEIDGSYGEVGGQLVRTALALSTLTQKPFQITNIRVNRPQPGLKAQHLTAITAFKEMCGAQTNPVEIGTTTLRYIPKPVKAGTYNIDIGTAGSITLLLQALLVPLLFAAKKTTLIIMGGTAGKWQAPIEYFEFVLLPFLQRFARVTCTMQKRGYYPKGGGKVTITIEPKQSWEAHTKSPPAVFSLADQGKLVYIKGVSHASSDLADRKVAERQASSAQLFLKQYNVPIEIQTSYSNTLSTGSGITLWARFHKEDEFHTMIGADELGEQGTTAENVGTRAAQKLIKEIDSNAAIDAHAADQLLPFIALLPGSVIKASSISEHARTNMWVIEKFFPVKFKIDGRMISVKQND